ncbi:hypothetical protein EXIGLDRAFT_219523 [Exidia glandulosa HHB12029]|uniref:Zn(2)-C6 fungal-type domain-containing protein n=1 Tax=Exidia glandulosa HHB12029 TaxID=1314781 RepID=A0A165ECV1_EXIGL|nr:hypothetical protein EXIGLDRAFT_219523 [Exidia glandulosa HHB12029]
MPKEQLQSARSGSSVTLNKSCRECSKVRCKYDTGPPCERCQTLNRDCEIIPRKPRTAPMALDELKQALASLERRSAADLKELTRENTMLKDRQRQLVGLIREIAVLAGTHGSTGYVPVNSLRATLDSVSLAALLDDSATSSTADQSASLAFAGPSRLAASAPSEQAGANLFPGDPPFSLPSASPSLASTASAGPLDGPTLPTAWFFGPDNAINTLSSQHDISSDLSVLFPDFDATTVSGLVDPGGGAGTVL